MRIAVDDDCRYFAQVGAAEQTVYNFVAAVSGCVDNGGNSPPCIFSECPPCNFTGGRKKECCNGNCKNKCDDKRNLVVMLFNKNADGDAEKAEKRADAHTLYFIGGRNHDAGIQTCSVKHGKDQRQIDAVINK